MSERSSDQRKNETLPEINRRLPVARVVDDNQPDRTAVVTILCDSPTLEVGTLLYRLPFNQAAELVKAFQAGIAFAQAPDDDRE